MLGKHPRLYSILEQQHHEVHPMGWLRKGFGNGVLDGEGTCWKVN